MDAQETTIYYSVLIAGILIGCIILYFAFSVIRYQSRHLKMQRGFFLREISLLEKDRTRIAYDLHDELGPQIALAQIKMRTAMNDAERRIQLLTEADENLNVIMERLGGIASNLTPRSLHVKGLRFALMDFITQVAGSSSIKLLFDYNINKEVSSEIAIHIYRIVQEVVHNAIKHSEAAQIEVSIRERGKLIRILCRDDGKGFFIYEQQGKSEGIGLRSLQSRTAMVNGKMHSFSAPGKGTKYLFEIPF